MCWWWCYIETRLHKYRILLLLSIYSYLSRWTLKISAECRCNYMHSVYWPEPSQSALLCFELTHQHRRRRTIAVVHPNGAETEWSTMSQWETVAMLLQSRTWSRSWFTRVTTMASSTCHVRGDEKHPLATTLMRLSRLRFNWPCTYIGVNLYTFGVALGPAMLGSTPWMVLTALAMLSSVDR